MAYVALTKPRVIEKQFDHARLGERDVGHHHVHRPGAPTRLSRPPRGVWSGGGMSLTPGRGGIVHRYSSQQMSTHYAADTTSRAGVRRKGGGRDLATPLRADH